MKDRNKVMFIDDNLICSNEQNQNMEAIDRAKIGRRSRRIGASFENKVRNDLKKQGFLVARWTNNVDLEKKEIIPAKSNCFNMRTTGFPDFIAMKHIENGKYVFVGIECKVNGYLDREEKEKIKIYRENMVFSWIWVAKKGKKGEVVYEKI